MNKNNIDKLITQALAIEAEEAREAGALGFMARALTQATLPHSLYNGDVFERRNGAFSLAIIAHPGVGLPYGSYPRLLLSWLTTEAVRTRCPELELGSTLSGFMDELGLIPAGGRWGTIHRLRDQMTRLFSSSVSCMYDDKIHGAEGTGFRLTKKFKLWWNPKAPDQAALWKSFVTLSRDFYDEVITNPVPVDMRALKALKRSPMALDIYCWMTYRMSYLRKPTIIPWGALQMQFGSGYSFKTSQGRRDFKKAFLKHLIKVQAVYPAARVEDADSGLLLKRSPTHVPSLSRG